jgi:micrococcal nuclease
MNCCQKKEEIDIQVVVPTKVLLCDEIKWEDTEPFVFPVTEARVIKVYDADTITIAAKLPYETSSLYRISVRLKGIDAPEIKGSSAEEKTMALEAKEFLISMVLNKTVRLENKENEKYGRLLADVFLGNIHINDLLLKERFAIPYDGGTKLKPRSWRKYKETGEI